MSEKHVTVLLEEAVEALVVDDCAFYVDGTFGRGGHSRLVLEKLSAKGRLLGIDKDPMAIAEGAELAQRDPRFHIEHGSFAQIGQFVTQCEQQNNVAGILVDLGVSSPQLNIAERGFSFLNDGPLDMRMNTEAGQSAAQWINSASEADIAHVLKVYGEERFSRRMAAAIVAERQKSPIERTLRLANIVKEANPAWEKGKHPATRAFQAIRIFINQELAELEVFLEQSLALLRPGGRLVVISFHSLEDRIVKRFIRDKERGKPVPKGVPLMDSQLDRQLKSMGKAVRASQSEVALNVRSRSAIMRIAEKLGKKE